MSQPFEVRPFRQVRVPQWVEGTVGCGYTLSVMDAAGRAEAARHGVTISEMGFVNPFFACYDSRFIANRSPEYPSGRVAREIAEYKQLGVRILAVYPPCLPGEVYEKHPDSDRGHAEVPARRDALPARAVRRFHDRRAGGNPHDVPRRGRV